MYELDDEFSEQFKILQKNYITKLREKFTQIELIGKEAIETRGEIDCLKNLYNFVHKLSGSSSMFGFAIIGQISNDFEIKLKQIIENKIFPITDEQITSISIYIENLKEALIIIEETDDLAV